jgi:hypothetical protein
MEFALSPYVHRSPLGLVPVDNAEQWELLSTGRSSNEGLEAWVAKEDGGFRMKGVPPTPLEKPATPAVPADPDAADAAGPANAAAPGPTKAGRRRKGSRGRSKDRRPSSSENEAPVDEAAAAIAEARKGEESAEPRDRERAPEVMQPPKEGKHRRKEAAASVARALSSALGLTPGAKKLVSKAAEMGAAAALALPPTPPLDTDVQDAGEPVPLGDVSNRANNKRIGRRGGKKGNKRKGKGKKDVAAPSAPADVDGERLRWATAVGPDCA